MLNRACPIPYSLKDTTFYLFLSLANENLKSQVNEPSNVYLFDLREDGPYKDYFSYVESSPRVCKKLRKQKV